MLANLERLFRCILPAMLLTSAVVATAGASAARIDTVGALLADVAGKDGEKAMVSADDLAAHVRERDRIVPALIRALRTGEWDRCGGDVREAIAWALRTLDAREAVPVLLEVANSDRPIEHECAE